MLHCIRQNAAYSAVLALLLAGTATLHGDDHEKKVRELMHKKLTHSSKILEGIAVNDFEKIGDNAADLILISKAAEWHVLKTPQYEVLSNDFRRSAETLVLMAKAKNTDGAALTYVDMTLTCVKCHKHVREVRMARGQ